MKIKAGRLSNETISFHSLFILLEMSPYFNPFVGRLMLFFSFVFFYHEKCGGIGKMRDAKT